MSSILPIYPPALRWLKVDQPKYVGEAFHCHLYMNAWVYSPALVALKLKPKDGHATLWNQVYSDGTCIFLDPAAEIVEWRLERHPNYFCSDEGTAEFNGWLLQTYVSLAP